jgi:hypothetical protein
MPPRKTRPAPTPPTGPLEIIAWFRQWLALRQEEKFLGTRIKELHQRMCGTIEAEGYRDDKGSLYLDLDEPVEGYASLKYERRVTKVLNEARAEKMVTAKGLRDRCTALVLYLTDQEQALDLLQKHGLLRLGAPIEADLDEEEILKAHYDGEIDQDELDSIFDITESYAFKQVKE